LTDDIFDIFENIMIFTNPGNMYRLGTMF